jgi:hypothetical protein
VRRPNANKRARIGCARRKGHLKQSSSRHLSSPLKDRASAAGNVASELEIPKSGSHRALYPDVRIPAYQPQKRKLAVYVFREQTNIREQKSPCSRFVGLVGLNRKSTRKWIALDECAVNRAGPNLRKVYARIRSIVCAIALGSAAFARPFEPKDYGALPPCDGTQASRGALAFGSHRQWRHRTVSTLANPPPSGLTWGRSVHWCRAAAGLPATS